MSGIFPQEFLKKKNNMQMETHLVECKIDQSFDYLITAGGHSRREQQTHQQGTVSVRQANPKPSHIQAATSSSHLLQCYGSPPPLPKATRMLLLFSPSTCDGRRTAAAWRMDRAAMMRRYSAHLAYPVSDTYQIRIRLGYVSDTYPVIFIIFGYFCA